MSEHIFTVTISLDLGETKARRFDDDLRDLPLALKERVEDYIREETRYGFNDWYDLAVKVAVP